MNDYADSHGICFTKDQLVILHYSCEMYLVCVLFHFIFLYQGGPSHGTEYKLTPLSASSEIQAMTRMVAPTLDVS